MQRIEMRGFLRDLSLVQQHEASDQLLDRFLLEGYRKVINRKSWSWLIQPPQEITVTVQPFDLQGLCTDPMVFLRVLDLVPKNELELPLTQVTRSEASFFGSMRPLTSRPRLYYVENKQLFFVQDPSLDPYNISFYADPTWPDGDDIEPPIPEDFHEGTIANFALHRLWERQEDFDRSDAYLGRFEMAMQDLEYVENTKNRDRPKIFGEFAGAYTGNRNMPWLDGM